MKAAVKPTRAYLQPVRPHSSAARALTPRGTQKEATRNRVLDAARELFDTIGYEGATVRGIARQAGVSVGSVFTTFASKGAILSEVMQQRLGALYAELDRMAPQLRGSTADRLRSIFAIHFAFETPRTKLFLAFIMASYDWTFPPDAQPFGYNARLKAILRDCLAQGVEQGDVSLTVDLDEVVDLLMAAYGWTYRLAISDGADAKAMTAVMDRRIGLIASGFGTR